VTIERLDNPRVELEEHYYNVVYSGLADLGLQAHLLSDTLIDSLLSITKQYAHRARPEAMLPTIQWRSTSSLISR
jgi:UDP-sulfoquinovose synthase